MPSAATALFESNSPSSSPIAISGLRSSTYRPANGFSITAMAAARRVGGVTGRPISVSVSSTTVTILRMTALMPSRFPLSTGATPPHILSPAQRCVFRHAIAMPRFRSILARAARVPCPPLPPALPRSHMRDKPPTSRVTRRAPRSLSGCRSCAAQRRTAGCPGRSTALAMMVAAASACAAVRASTVTASAMPTRKTAPVPTAGGDAARGIVGLDNRGLHQTGLVRPIHQAHGKVLAFAKMQRDVAAVVDIGSIEAVPHPPSRREFPRRRRPRPPPSA